MLTVRPGQSFMGGIGRGQAQLTVEEAIALRDQGRNLGAVSPEMETRLQVERGANNANLSVVGTWPAYFTVNQSVLAEGRLFTESEDNGRRRVAVLGALVGNQLGVRRPRSSARRSGFAG